MDSARQHLIARLRAAGLPHAEAFAMLARSSIRLRAENARLETLPIGASRLGGWPDLPAGFSWPMRGERPLDLMCQIDLSDPAVRQCDPSELPSAGWLLCFYDADEQPWGEPRHQSDAVHVTHVVADRDRLRRTLKPGSNDHRPKTARVRLEHVLDLPDDVDEVFTTFCERAGVEFDEQQTEHYLELAAAVSGSDDADEAYTHLLGHPQIVQTPMRSECAVIDHTLAAGPPASHADSIRIATERWPQWTLLLQLDSEAAVDWMWGDGGRVYVFINWVDLRGRRFDRVRVILQCY